MTFIDWAYVGAHFLWIFGLSLILAAFSYHTWLRQERGLPLSAQLRQASWRTSLLSGLSLMVVSITVMPRSERWFIRLAALLVALLFASLAIRAFVGRRRAE